MDASWNTDTNYEMGNMGHRPGVKGATSLNPTDAGQDIRSEIVTMKRMGMKVDKYRKLLHANMNLVSFSTH